jgi:hypothetical protein
LAPEIPLEIFIRENNLSHSTLVNEVEHQEFVNFLTFALNLDEVSHYYPFIQGGVD